MGAVKKIATNLERMQNAVSKIFSQLCQLTNGYGDILTRIISLEDWVKKCKVGATNVSTRSAKKRENMTERMKGKWLYGVLIGWTRGMLMRQRRQQT